MILIVDPDELLLEAMHDFLSALGYDCIRAKESLQALDILAENPAVDLIICEQMLAQHSGIELVRLASGLHPAMKSILISGRENIDLIPANTCFLAKPFSFDSLGTLAGLLKNPARTPYTPPHTLHLVNHRQPG